MLSSVNVHEMDERIRRLYESSFSETEKIPLENIYRTIGRGGNLRFYRDDGRFIGFTFSFVDGDRMFLVYFATLPELRGQGYGGQILARIREDFEGVRTFLVVEPVDDSAPDREMRRRRQAFYRRNGCFDTGIQVISDDEWFDTLFVQGVLTEEEMVSTVTLYENIHNGRC